MLFLVDIRIRKTPLLIIISSLPNQYLILRWLLSLCRTYWSLSQRKMMASSFYFLCPFSKPRLRIFHFKTTNGISMMAKRINAMTA